METFQGRGDVLPAPGAGEHSRSRVLNILRSIQGFVGEPEQERVAVIPAGGNEMDEGLSNWFGKWPEPADVFEVKKGRPCNGFDVGLIGEGRVQDDTQVTNLTGWRDGLSTWRKKSLTF